MKLKDASWPIISSNLISQENVMFFRRCQFCMNLYRVNCTNLDVTETYKFKKTLQYFFCLFFSNLYPKIQEWHTENTKCLASLAKWRTAFKTTQTHLKHLPWYELDELTETVTSYISFCEDMCILSRTFLSFNNDKPWFTGKLKQLRQAKEDAYRSGDKSTSRRGTD